MKMAMKETTKQLEFKFTEPAEAGPAKEQTGSGKDYWSDCGQMFFAGGRGFGVTDTLAAICLGSEEDIKRYLNAGDNRDKFTAPQLKVLEQITIYREEEGYGESSGIGKRGMEGVRPNGRIRANQVTARPSKTKQRLPLRQARATVKGISRQ